MLASGARARAAGLRRGRSSFVVVVVNVRTAWRVSGGPGNCAVGPCTLIERADGLEPWKEVW